MTTSLNPLDSIFHAVAYNMYENGCDMEHVARDLAHTLVTVIREGLALDKIPEEVLIKEFKYLIHLTQDESHREPSA